MVSSEAPSKVKAAVQNVECVTVEFEKLQISVTEVQDNIQESIEESNQHSEVQEIIDNIGQLDKCLSYLNFVQCIEDIR